MGRAAALLYRRIRGWRAIGFIGSMLDWNSIGENMHLIKQSEEVA